MDQASQTQTSASANPAAGWYPDPQGQGLRWWDGSAWTEHTHNEAQANGAAAAATGTATSAAPAASTPSALSKSSAKSPAKEDGKKRVSFINDNAVPILALLAVVLGVVLALQLL